MAGFFGAVTALGMTLVLSSIAVMIALLAARVRHDPAAIAGILARSARIEILDAALLSFTVMGAFFCGGYVATRMGNSARRGQAVAVWLWALLAPPALILMALASGAGAVISVVRPSAAISMLGCSFAALSLVATLLGGDAGRRTCRRLTVSAAPGACPPSVFAPPGDVAPGFSPGEAGLVAGGMGTANS